jgi:CTP:molybdopterin cytidylyltransferase MocA
MTMRAAAVILAAGEGQRLGGACKATLSTQGGKTFVQAVAEAARAGGCGRVVVVAADPHLEATRKAAEGVCDDVVVNPDPSRGMSSSILVGLAALDPSSFDVALVWPVDVPYVKPETVASVLKDSTRERIVIPTYLGHGGHPTAFGADVWPEFEPAMAHQGAKTVLHKDPSRVARIALVDPGLVKDIDTPEDLAR